MPYSLPNLFNISINLLLLFDHAPAFAVTKWRIHSIIRGSPSFASDLPQTPHRPRWIQPPVTGSKKLNFPHALSRSALYAESSAPIPYWHYLLKVSWTKTRSFRASRVPGLRQTSVNHCCACSFPWRRCEV